MASKFQFRIGQMGVSMQALSSRLVASYTSYLLGNNGDRLLGNNGDLLVQP